MPHLECQTIDMAIVFNVLGISFFKDSVVDDSHCWRNTTVRPFFDKNVLEMTGFGWAWLFYIFSSSKPHLR